MQIIKKFGLKPPKIAIRYLSAVFLCGQAIVHILQGKLYRRNIIEQMAFVGPASLSISMLTLFAVGSVFTIQVAREFLNFGAGRVVGGVLALSLARELAPVLTAVVLAGRVGSAFAAEIGTMQVTEQIDALYMLRTDPVDYLVIPRLVSCCLMLPLLTIFSFVTGLLGGMIVASSIYNIQAGAFVDSARGFLNSWDMVSMCVKGLCFGVLVSIIGCNWGLTTTGGAKGVGDSTTRAVVVSILGIFVTNFFLSWLMFQGAGSAVQRGF